MIALIPIMGKSSRFVNAELPEKPFLPMPDGRTLLEWVVELLPSEIERVVFVTPAHHIKLNNFITDKFPNAEVVSLSKPTHDPLETLCLANKYLADEYTELYINYIDCLLYQADDFVESMKMQAASAGMVVFDSRDKRFQHDENGKAFGGLFWFEHTYQFFEMAGSVCVSEKADREIGAPHIVMQYPNYKVYDVGNGSGLFDLGTPEDYLKFTGRRAE